MGRACNTSNRKKGMHTGFWWGSQKERPVGRHRCRWEYNTKMALQEIRCRGMDWINLAQDRDQWQVLVNMVLNLQVP
jgi:hypothetical protein